MFKIVGLDHIVLRTANSHRLVKFYVDILGCQVERINAAIGLTHLRIGNNLLDILTVSEPSPTHKNLEHFCLRITPFNYEELKHYFAQYNIELLRYGDRYSSLGMGPSFYISDPDGNEIEFISEQ
jgi:glyoxylase I family protein